MKKKNICSVNFFFIFIDQSYAKCKDLTLQKKSRNEQTNREKNDR